jgi:uncharacterized SAM-binding protein YcdF (DUF218 family)
VLLALVAFGFVFFRRVHPFLAVTHPVHADLLVIEGWIPHSAIRTGASEFTNGAYRLLFTTGGPVYGAEESHLLTSATVAANILKDAGIPEDRIRIVPSQIGDRDRTYGAAVALQRWLRDQNLKITRLNLLTHGVHARRSRLLFQKAFGDSVKIGIISVPNPDYDAAHWWRYSEGIKEVVSEGSAYLYVRLFFHP